LIGGSAQFHYKQIIKYKKEIAKKRSIADVYAEALWLLEQLLQLIQLLLEYG